MTDATITAAPTMSAHDAAVAAYADSSSVPPETSTTPASASAPTTAAPGPTETAAVPVTTETQTQAQPGEPPQWRWQDIKENTRRKAAEETEARIRAEYAWANAIAAEQREHLPTALQLMQALNTDPQGTLERLRQQFGVGGPAAPGGRPEPDVDAGNGTYLYSAQQQEKLNAWNREQILHEVNQRFAPIEQERQAREAAEQKRAFEQNVRQQFERMQARPHFKEHMADIRAAMTTDETLSIQDAYAQVLLEKVIPSLAKQSESTVLAQLQTRAVQATVNPSSATPSAPGSLIGNARAAAEAAYRDA